MGKMEKYEYVNTKKIKVAKVFFWEIYIKKILRKFIKLNNFQVSL